jgi:sec-independent protein translocase protein TatC
VAKSKKHRQTGENGELVMGLSDHLREFRNRLAVVLVIFIVALLASFSYSNEIFEGLKTLAGGLYQFQILSPSEQFTQYIKLSLLVGLCVDSPFILYELFAFASPGLKPNEKKFLLFLLIAGFGFFILGAVFAFKIMLPFMLQFFANFNQSADIIMNVSIEKFITLCTSTMLTLGIVFEMPVLTLLLTQLGLLKPEWLTKSRRVMIVVIFFVAAVITPPDVVSQVMVAIPMLILYEISVFFSGFAYKQRLKRNPYLAEEEAERRAEEAAEKADQEAKEAQERAAAARARANAKKAKADSARANANKEKDKK